MKGAWPWVGGGLVGLAGLVLAMNVFLSVPDPRSTPTMVVQHVADPIAALLAIRDGGCVEQATIDYVMPDLGGVDATVTLQPWIRGWIDAGHGPRVFYGTLEEAVRALGGSEIAIGPQEIWFKTGPTSAQSIREIRTPLGRTVWMAKDAAEQC